jgi:TDG/mug DNA glycosylase family protein
VPEPTDPSRLLGFQGVVSWQDDQVLTLADVPPVENGIILNGINPSPVSVEVGHYYQGTLGKRLWSRLAAVGLLERSGSAWEDERWQAAGNGLSDVVKRPTAAASSVSDDEMTAGAEALRAKLVDWKPGLILFPFLASAAAVLGSPPSVGRGPAVDGIPTFRMEGPYASSSKVEHNVRELGELLVRMLNGTAAEEPTSRPEVPPAAPTTAEVLSQPVTAADKTAGRIRFPRHAKGVFPSSRSTVTFVLRGIRQQGHYDPRSGPDRERSAVLSVGRQALLRVSDSERLRVTVRATDGLVSLD